MVEARRKYEEGQYDHPDRYYINTSIPKKRFDPALPENVIPWDTDLMMLAVQESMDATHITEPATTQHEDPPAPAPAPYSTTSLESSGCKPPPTYSTATPATHTNVGFSEGAAVSSQTSSLAQDNIPNPSSSGLPSISASSSTGQLLAVDNRMKHILNYFFGFGADEIDSVDAILAVPRYHYRLYPTLTRAGMDDNEAILFCDCLLGTLPEFDW